MELTSIFNKDTPEVFSLIQSNSSIYKSSVILRGNHSQRFLASFSSPGASRYILWLFLKLFL